jgi:hypothetical protein
MWIISALIGKSKTRYLILRVEAAELEQRALWYFLGQKHTTTPLFP